MSCIWMRLKINFPWCHPRALCSARWAEGLRSASLCKVQRLAMFLLPPQSIAFWAPLVYVTSTASYGNGFPCLIMIFVENVLSWVCLFVLNSLTAQFIGITVLPVLWKTVKKLFLFPFSVLFLILWGSVTKPSVGCASSNMKILKLFFLS